MKKHINKLLTLGLISLLLVVGCTKDFEEMNKDPNEPTSVPTSYLFTNAEKALMTDLWDEWWNGRFGMMYSQYWSQTSYTDESRYSIRDNNTNTYWALFYRSAKDLAEIIELNTNADTKEKASASGANENQIGAAMTLKAWIAHVMADTWGDIPYSEAFEGADNPTPAYDKQQNLYPKLLSELKEASNMIDVSKVGIEGDIIYNGDMAKWKKFANSLRLRIALRIHSADATTAENHIKEILNDSTQQYPVFESNDDNALFTFLETVPNNNPLNENQKTRADFAISDRTVGLLTSLSDPRLDVFADYPEATPNTHRGMPYGLDQATATSIPNDSVSMPSWNVYKPTAPGIFMQYAEVEFIKAEIYSENIVTGDAQTAYENAITASMNFWGITDATAISNYIGQADVTWSSADAQDLILEQKWISLYMQGLEAWGEWRRTGKPDIITAPESGSIIPLSGTILPTRRTYPSEEQSLNSANYQSAVNSIGGDNMDTKLYWDND